MLGRLIWKLLLRPAGRARLSLLFWFRRQRATERQVLYAVVPADNSPTEVTWMPAPPQRMQGAVRCVCISDTHLQHRRLHAPMPLGDILIHCGDVLLESSGATVKDISALTDFNNWLGTLSHKHRVLVAGNHDGAFRDLRAAGVKNLLPQCRYLEDESMELERLKIHGSPLSAGASSNDAFQSQSGYDEAKAVSAIPEGLDILVTHGPAGEGALGRASARLQERIDQVRPRVHVFGHYHLGHGVVCSDGADVSEHFSCGNNDSSVLPAAGMLVFTEPCERGAVLQLATSTDVVLQFWKLEARHLYLLLNWPDCLMRANLDATGREVLLKKLGHPNSLAVDDVRQKLYFSESDDESDRIMRCDLDGGNLEEVVTDVHVQGIATDSEGRVYWTELSSSQIQRSSLNGSGAEVLVRDLQEPAGLVVDSQAGRMYWADQCGYEETGRIQSARLDGSDVTTLYNASHPMHVALDSRGQVYWTDAGSFEIRRWQPDGSFTEVLYNKTVVPLPDPKFPKYPHTQRTGLLDPQGIAVDSVEGKVYWTQLGTQYAKHGGPSIQRNSKLQRANLDGSEIETLAEFGATQPVALVISNSPTAHTKTEL
ncbi:unnamed protein product [Symbiodinium natans]|uniref:Calcineurin-like phosphoesterase domain-containing protein n=1 Tax=Symbiodinium natans TaxID=878477 RepID=A0A812V1N8_9DINO|nr:unnamed protein product [Symbiodinium natans]